MANRSEPHQYLSRDFLLTNKSRAKYNSTVLGQILFSLYREETGSEP
jgi:hypothetical protein